MTGACQTSLFDLRPNEVSISDATPAGAWERDAAKHALDELFSLTHQYKSSQAYQDLLKFVTRFLSYSPFNAMLVHIQMPGAKFVAPPYRWLRDYGRRIGPGARPLIILQPMGPVMFVFDVSETEPTESAPPLPPEVENPFEVRKGYVGGSLELVVDNAKRDGLRVTERKEGSQSAGSICYAPENLHASQQFQAGIDKNRNSVFMDIPVKYDLGINAGLSREARYATIVHELAHLYCGHLGTPKVQWWPDRRGLSHEIEEFEAESVAYLVCLRCGIDISSEQYLSHYVWEREQVPPISLERVMKAAGLIESMSRRRMKPRKPSQNEAGG